MIQNKDGNIIVTADYTKQQKIGVFLLIFISFIMIVCMYFHWIRFSFFYVGGVFYIPYILHHKKITISSNMLGYRGEFNGNKIVYFDDISKCKFTEDYDIVMYDNDGNEDECFDITGFDKPDIQVLMNILSEKKPMLVDNSLIDEGYSVPQSTTNETTSSRRRRVVEPKETKQASQNHIVRNTSRDNESAPNRRKLEL